ncbi:MAG: 50S ribosomal protein L29 [Bacteroidetes bacterium]|jgi:large subunit ribosomal protein L29|nr:50S ribosomal protein L29 [Bacteroidota bacterium]
MKQKEITQMSLSEIQEKLSEEKATLVKLELNHTVSPIENPLKIRGSRRTIARLNTEIRKREIAGTKN